LEPPGEVACTVEPETLWKRKEDDPCRYGYVAKSIEALHPSQPKSTLRSICTRFARDLNWQARGFGVNLACRARSFQPGPPLPCRASTDLHAEHRNRATVEAFDREADLLAGLPLREYIQSA
jgi:hypothetical protein